MTIAALITQGVGPGGSVLYLLTEGLDVGTQPPIVIDTHDGGERREEHWDDDRKRRKRRQAQVIDAFERLIEGKVDAVEAQEIVRLLEQREEESPQTFDFDKFLSSASQLQRLWDQYIEDDDMEIVALL